MTPAKRWYQYRHNRCGQAAFVMLVERPPQAGDLIDADSCYHLNGVTRHTAHTEVVCESCGQLMTGDLTVRDIMPIDDLRLEVARVRRER